MNKVTELASTTVNVADAVTVQLLRAEDIPASARTVHPGIVRIVWPLQPTIVDPNRFPEVAAAVVRMFAAASTELAAIKARICGHPHPVPSLTIPAVL